MSSLNICLKPETEDLDFLCSFELTHLWSSPSLELGFERIMAKCGLQSPQLASAHSLTAIGCRPDMDWYNVCRGSLTTSPLANLKCTKNVCLNLLHVSIQQGKKVCKVTVLRCYQCFSLRFLLAATKWLNKNKLQGSVLNCAGAQ